MNLAWRDIRHSLGRFLLTCVGLGMLLGVVLSMIGIYRGMVDDALVIARTTKGCVLAIRRHSLFQIWYQTTLGY